MPTSGARWLLAALLAALGAAACDRPEVSGERPVVLVSVRPQAWFVERLAAGRVAVETLLPPAASPVLYEPTLAQLAAVSRASIYVKVGHPAFPFERAWLEPLLAENPDLVVVDTSEGAGADPHVWLSPDGARTTARRVAQALGDLLPGARREIAANLARLEGQIDAVDAELRGLLEPRRGARFYVFHPAWQRWADAYGLEQVAIERDGKEPDPHTLALLIEQARADGVRVIFVQPQFGEASARVVAEEIGARLVVIDPLAYDWPANLRRVGARVAEGAVP